MITFWRYKIAPLEALSEDTFKRGYLPPYSFPDVSPMDYVIGADRFNDHIPNNVDLLCGDPMVELQQCEVVFGSIDRSPNTRPVSSGLFVECVKQLLFQ